MITFVRFRKDATSIGHHSEANKDSSFHERAGVARDNQELVGIYLPPEKPSQSWICGTRFVWRIADEDVIRLTGSLPMGGHICACEHMLELD